MAEDPLVTAKRDAAVREARRLYPDISPVLAGWVWDYVQSVGEEAMEKRIREGYYEKSVEKEA